MPKKPADLKQTKLSFAPNKKTPPPIVISSPNRKSVSDLADNFEQNSIGRVVTRSRSNLSISTQSITKTPQKRAASLDNNMSAGAAVGLCDIDTEKSKDSKEVEDTLDPSHEVSGDGPQPSNAEIMKLLMDFKQDFNSDKGIKTEIKAELAEFRTETCTGMANLQANMKGLGENQKTLESRIEIITNNQDSLAQQVKDLREELNSTKKDLAEHRQMTGTDMNKIADNMKAAAEKVTLEQDLQKAINETAKMVVIQGYHPDKDLSDLDSAKKFLKDIMGKRTKEIDNLELLSASFSKTDSDFPSGLLTFKLESSVTSLLKEKKKCRDKGLKLKESVPLVYRDMQRKYRSEAYNKYIKGFATWVGFEGTHYIMRYKKKDNAAKGEYYEWTVFDDFKPSSIRASGDGFVTNKKTTPLDNPDTVLIQYKEPKPSSDALVTEIKTLVLDHLKELGVTAQSIAAIDSRGAKITTSQDNVSRVKSVVETYITPAQGATITII